MIGIGNREKFSFWLDLRKDDQFLLADMIYVLKKKRQFASTIRDGIRLVTSLRAGRVNVLLELFPWVVDEFRALPEPSPNTDLTRQLAKLEALLSEQPTPPPTGTTGIPDGHPRPLTAPAPDDDTPLVKRKVASDGAESRNNFLNSAFNLVSE